jgi:hypothetical protein
MIDPVSIEIDEAFDRFDALLQSIAAGLPVDRSAAMRYSEYRSMLLDSPYRDALPGFVLQCMSVSRFREFISLYDPAARAREAFVRDLLADCRAVQARRASFARAGTSKAAGEWTL